MSSNITLDRLVTHSLSRLYLNTSKNHRKPVPLYGTINLETTNEQET